MYVSVRIFWRLEKIFASFQGRPKVNALDVNAHMLPTILHTYIDTTPSFSTLQLNSQQKWWPQFRSGSSSTNQPNHTKLTVQTLLTDITIKHHFYTLGLTWLEDARCKATVFETTVIVSNNSTSIIEHTATTLSSRPLSRNCGGQRYGTGPKSECLSTALSTRETQH